MAIDNPGWSYLMELQIAGWNRQHPIDDSLKSATEHFHRSMIEHVASKVRTEGSSKSAEELSELESGFTARIDSHNADMEARRDGRPPQE